MFLDLHVGNLAEPLSGRVWDQAAITREIGLRVARFQRHGLARGDRVFLPFGNRLEFFAELLAIWRLGACAVPIDARLTPFEITTLVGAAQPRMAVVDDATDAGGARSAGARRPCRSSTRSTPAKRKARAGQPARRRRADPVHVRLDRRAQGRGPYPPLLARALGGACASSLALRISSARCACCRRISATG
jgi:acyl-CoA synthetase (AMP-forming)/AMP-acid ligase II